MEDFVFLFHFLGWKNQMFVGLKRGRDSKRREYQET